MEISKGVEMLHLDFHGNIIHPVLLWDRDMAVLIDTGFPEQMDDLRVAMEKVGVSLDKLKAVILTHQDVDHIGSLPEILQECGDHVHVYAHELEKPYVQGEKPLLKDGHLENPPKGRVDYTVSDGQELPFCGGIRVIHTPGHTPGHISLYLTKSKTLIAGDSMYSVNGILAGIHEPTTPDMDAARLSIKKYVDLDIASVVCYHGGFSHGNVKGQIVGLSQGLR
ncbi:MBL fold metallo-hydrolase [Brevibacillus porteri]|uniref:MBL fold metallo-hydrolase n=1 Tax=Brevibacillus porteri TaxID=2126350 RepID=A0ABX5FQ19_9BACL|nr:MBL fold metallo-hydrolase [Brevibacillus porteri]MED1799385.1 MBL fold metallo-hydrolase [Brevibacillus porteri]MED2131859.1 MBL fold metallo-hydrolase [Brevibacillus porteri]MED2742818.1 MBL fold metallo-hydrolase [Brevibacillus porteri]MED2817846.1 MBL fold metallo-hydrolase [Brevibacillus porteri]MED2893148.1 MBL fold metallo-hydrolase [Brevibacillus porteri]